MGKNELKVYFKTTEDSNRFEEILAIEKWYEWIKGFITGLLVGIAGTLIFAITAEAATQKDRAQIETSVKKWARHYQINPNLVKAIIHVESRGRRMTVGQLGEVGLMQLRPEFHRCASFSIDKNIRCGVRYLKHVEKKCKSKYGRAFFICYNTGPNGKKLKNPYKFPYYKRVNAAYKELI